MSLRNPEVQTILLEKYCFAMCDIGIKTKKHMSQFWAVDYCTLHRCTLPCAMVNVSREQDHNAGMSGVTLRKAASAGIVKAPRRHCCSPLHHS